MTGIAASTSPAGSFDPCWSLTGSELIARAAAWGRKLRGIGLGPGDSVALALSRGPDLAPLHLAALAGGLTVLPLNTSMASPELASVLEAARPSLLIAAPSFLERHDQVRAAFSAPWWSEEDGSGDNDDRGDGSGELDVAERGDQDAAIVLFTSGTTGSPKSVPLSHANLRANLLALAALWQRSDADRLLHVLPAHHFHGLVLGLYGTLATGGALLMMPGFDAVTTLAAIPALRINLLMAVPTIYARLLEHSTQQGGDPRALAGLRLAISGSAPLPASLWEAFHRHFDVPLMNRYGLTETGIATSMRPGTQRAGVVGSALPLTTVAICDEAGIYHTPSLGAATPRGEICMRGPSVTAGYGNAPEANAAAFRGGYFHSGDLGRFDEHGDLWVEGRLKELIIVGGSNVVPGEVEAPLSQVDGVAEIVVAGSAHRDLGEIVVAWIVAREPSADQASIEKDLRDRAELSLAPYKRPRAYVFLDEIPRNAMGKVDKKKLVLG